MNSFAAQILSVTSFKKAILFIHRWLGFISGLIVVIISITGCIFCFQDEIQDAMYSWRHVEVQHRPYVSPSVLKQTAMAKYPGSSATYQYYWGPDRPALVLVAAKTGFLDVVLDPYSGNITHVEKAERNFFVIVEYIHLYLLLPPAIGVWVVGGSVLIFVVLMITGIILWWPRRKTDFKRSLEIKWNGRWRRVNYDLHKVFGVYVTAIAFILAITGLAIAFGWMRDGLYSAANLGVAHPSEKMIWKSDTLSNHRPANALDIAFSIAQQQSPQAQMFLLSDDGKAASTINITAYAKTLHYGHNDTYVFDRGTGKLLQHLPYSQKSTGLKLTELNYDLHVGQALGLPGKIIALLASLICASLPITGFLIWLGRKKKKPRVHRLPDGHMVKA